MHSAVWTFLPTSHKATRGENADSNVLYNYTMNIKSGQKIVAIILAVFFIGLVSVDRAKNIPYERDEISWYFHTKFFDTAFIQKDIFSPYWQGYESYDHPQVSKYIYGAYLYTRDAEYALERDALEHKYGRWDFYTNIKSDPDISKTEFASIINELRKINIVLTLFIVAEIFALFYILTSSILFSFLTCIAFIYNDLFTNSTTVITSDNHLLLFSLLAIICYLRSLRSKHLFWVISASVATSFAVGSKLTGIFICIAVILAEIIHFQTFKRVAVYMVVTIFMWIAINPAIYAHPIQSSWRYFAFRSFQSANIAYHVPEAALNTIPERIKAIVCSLVIHPCEVHWTPGSLSSSNLLNSTLLIMGLWYCAHAIRNRKREIIFLIILGYVICMGYIASLSNYADRYFALPQFVVFFIQMFGLWSFVHALVSHHKFRRNHIGK